MSQKIINQYIDALVSEGKIERNAIKGAYDKYVTGYNYQMQLHLDFNHPRPDSAGAPMEFESWLHDVYHYGFGKQGIQL